MKIRSLVLSCFVLATAVGIVACGGGGGSSTPSASSSVLPSTSPVAATTPIASAGATTLAEAALLGSLGFTNTDGRTVYVLSDDTVSSLACTVASGCTGVWPPVSPPGGVALSAGFTVFARPDNGAMQLALNNHPLYEYAGDSAAGQTNGNGLVSFGGTWSIAHP
jgi:predicted lipoprotein with Yx(FWY)xxD motif